MPLVTVASRPNGEPIATTLWPTSRSSELADGGRGEAATPSAWITRGVGERVGAERPSPSAWVPSLKLTLRSRRRSPASSTTWLLVRISPSELRMMPEPEPGLLRAAHVDLHDRGQHGLRHALDRVGRGSHLLAVDDRALRSRRGRLRAGAAPDQVVHRGEPGAASQAAEPHPR